MFCFSNVFVIISLVFFMYLECETYIPARAFSSLRSCDHSVEGAPWKPHGLVMVLGFACGSFASVGREASQEAGQACFWCPEAESNHRHEDFQSSALPTELSGLIYNYFTYFKLNFNICQIFISFLCILSFIKFCYKL